MRDDRLRLEDIRDACGGLWEDFRRNHAEEIWSDAINFRNVLAHQYRGIDYEAVWAVVDRDLPATPGRESLPASPNHDANDHSHLEQATRAGTVEEQGD